MQVGDKTGIRTRKTALVPVVMQELGLGPGRGKTARQLQCSSPRGNVGIAAEVPGFEGPSLKYSFACNISGFVN